MAEFAAGAKKVIRSLKSNGDRSGLNNSLNIAPQANSAVVTSAPGTLNGRIFFWSLTSALAGFLFGFDTVVISGAEKTIQALWGLSAGTHGIAMASAPY